ncbi:MAG TPA: efflux RND transporter periplasmic adaptor subunit [Bryobacteraceae bacterium]|nr:efflux RND transporter periplasmic adaptor subunit [Bryobacteraceae bacterium]
MKRRALTVGLLFAAIPSVLSLGGCGSVQANTTAEAPPAAKVVTAFDVNMFSVEHPEQFPVATASAQSAAPELVVTGTVNPDVARNVPAISLASGRVMAIHARLGDTVTKGQLLLTVRSDDISGAFSNYRKALADETLSRTQLERTKDLYDHGAMSLNDLQVAQDTDDKAKVDVETMAEHLRLLGTNPDHPNSMVDIYAPVSGVITDQEVTMAAAVQSFGTNPFTISDLSTVWIICDVYENDLPNVRIGDTAEIRLNAYPDRALQGTVSNIGAILDPNIRTAKVRIEVANPGMMRMGMFVTATFRGRRKEEHTVLPAAAILHLHDRDWVYVPAPDKKFRRVEVVSGDPLPNGLQEVTTGIKPGEQVVANAVVLDHTIAINQ